MLEDEVRLPIRSHAGVNQFGDMRMRKLAENSAFALEPLRTASGYRKMQELYCDTPLETAIAALRQPHAAHATLADRRSNPVCADCLPCERGLAFKRGGAVLQKVVLCDCAVLFEEFLHKFRKLGLLRSK